MLVLAVQESQRVDRQLKGRAGRQGDPGETYTLVRVDDPIAESVGMGAGLALVKPFFEGDSLSCSCLPFCLGVMYHVLSKADCYKQVGPAAMLTLQGHCG